MLARSILKQHILNVPIPNRIHRFFTVLALESSADDTCAAVVTSDRQILSNVVVKQNHLHVFLLIPSRHEEWGGIHVITAMRYHQLNMPGAINKALKDAKISATDLDGIAFTRGPGMQGCLTVCSNSAKAIAAALEKPLVGVHHMQAHALTPLLTQEASNRPEFPFLTLLVSGGHTMLLVTRSPTDFKILATTDMSIGNAIDKISRMLGLNFGGLGPGVALEKFCMANPSPNAIGPLDKHTDSAMLSFPLGSLHKLEFSYSGVYSAVQRYIERGGGAESFSLEEKAKVAWAFMRAATGQLEEKLRLGLKWCENNDVDVRHVVVSGGVASNLFIRERLVMAIEEAKMREHVSLVYPPIALCTDNAAMIGWASMYRFLKNDHDPYDILNKPIWSLEDLQQ
ncbi:hypothetical protein M422DRAFT_161218 [Sphaerobolus stellatus SS14]|nr:hypothetical protein M422DRAFT_161218 [Sphaerobolus stellatus SS14]